MTRYKGHQSAKAVEQEFPHFVDIAVPPGGLGPRLNAMYDFHARHGIQPKRGQWRRADDGGSVIRWCFTDQARAGAFASEFNGK
jgi:hypothetical protein